jgi:hypothetical protein
VIKKNRICIEADDASRRADALAQQGGYSARTAADIETVPTRTDANLIQHDRAIGCHGRTLNMEAFDLAVAALDRVVTGA